jgi:hypothetical protein
MPEPDPMLRLCSLTESETKEKYDKHDSDNVHAASMRPFAGGSGGPGENIYDEPTASAPLLGKKMPTLKSYQPITYTAITHNTVYSHNLYDNCWAFKQNQFLTDNNFRNANKCDILLCSSGI